MHGVSQSFSISDKELSEIVLRKAFKLHTALGNGLLESVYRTCLAHDLKKEGLFIEEEKTIPIIYDGIVFEKGFRLDLLIEKRLILELKVADSIHPNHIAQTLSYLQLTGVRHGLILNFYERSLKNGIKRLVR